MPVNVGGRYLAHHKVGNTTDFKIWTEGLCQKTDTILLCQIFELIAMGGVKIE